MNDLMRGALRESSSRASHLPSPMMSAGTDAVLHLPINESGRDIVIGDVHGQSAAFERLLDRLEVDLDGGDRLILLGDLVDRGEDSWGMIDWYAPQPSVFVLRGNHEQMLIDAADPQWMNLWRHNGGAWHETPPEGEGTSPLIDESPDDSSRDTSWPAIDRIRQHCLALPFAIAIEQKDADPVVCVHAEIPNGWSWPDFAQVLEEEDSACGRQARLAALWGRSRINSAYGCEMPVAGAALCIYGHIPIREVQHQANCLWIDTGAAYPNNYRSARITAVQVQGGGFEEPISEGIVKAPRFSDGVS
ncbi:metallophosphoesterase [Thioalkalivibrio sp. HK1]|uniref:metallophosphoesterase n=1 Tax=Thioalkalivibrio sp. HK1 TaxID=1469245 RepID=UPI000471ECBC|nr:metallophosphoesterase [Thioalkalivibrio sp. HK1]